MFGSPRPPLPTETIMKKKTKNTTIAKKTAKRLTAEELQAVTGGEVGVVSQNYTPADYSPWVSADSWANAAYGGSGSGEIYGRAE